MDVRQRGLFVAERRSPLASVQLQVTFEVRECLWDVHEFPLDRTDEKPGGATMTFDRETQCIAAVVSASPMNGVSGLPEPPVMFGFPDWLMAFLVGPDGKTIDRIH